MAMSADRPVRIGLVGAGAIMRLSHAPTTQRSSGAVLAAVFDVDPARAEGLAQDYAIPRFTTDLAALVEGDDIDAVIVATPNAHHETAVIAAAGAASTYSAKNRLASTSPAREDGGRGRRSERSPAGRLQSALLDAGRDRQVPHRQRFHRRGPRIPLGLCRAVGPLSGNDPLSLRSEALRRRDDHRPDDPPYRPRPPSDRRLRLDRRGPYPQRRARCRRRQCLAPRPLRLGSPGIACHPTATRRRSATAPTFSARKGRSTLPPRPSTRSTACRSPCYTDRSADELPDFLREAHYPDAWWNKFEGGWIGVKPPRKNPYDKQLAGFVDAIRTGRPTLATGCRRAEGAGGGAGRLPLADRAALGRPAAAGGCARSSCRIISDAPLRWRPSGFLSAAGKSGMSLRRNDQSALMRDQRNGTSRCQAGATVTQSLAESRRRVRPAATRLGRNLAAIAAAPEAATRAAAIAGLSAALVGGRGCERLVGCCAVVLALVFLDPHAPEWARDLPRPARAFFRAITDFGKSEWFLVPSGLLVIAVALADWRRVPKVVAAAWAEIGALLVLISSSPSRVPG